MVKNIKFTLEELKKLDKALRFVIQNVDTDSEAYQILKIKNKLIRIKNN
tara:strand:+ start:1639 stop:1785 length:147 start_codon:yes stop_codon:yes gene_type:complete